MEELPQTVVIVAKYGQAKGIRIPPSLTINSELHACESITAVHFTRGH